jgi:hypothetical protein
MEIQIGDERQEREIDGERNPRHEIKQPSRIK